ncbi:ABC-type iron(III) transport system, permease component [Thermococcus sp. 4557]|uniref:ABC transporter permease n=1 Tax=Thermococcus sp. (strain CGMCC 1.5172 / 4557) TaxID=1042877 RepID=UPI000219EBA0|nr:iron ABC transporter permease [Thermococcus sp. 4557]AEK74004.1 ABC-type iron(III) transport system, permease component [Thermococcus sp. 4557]
MKVSKWSERLFGTPLFDPVVTTSFLFPLLYLVAFLIIPVLAMLAVAFEYNGHFSFHWFTSILTSEYYISWPTGEFSRLVTLPSGEQIYYVQGVDFGVILNSIIVSLSVMILTTILGTVFAFVMARYNFPGKNIVRILLFVPLLVTPFVNVFIVKKMFLPNGLINWLFYDILHVFPHRIVIDGLVGVIVAQAMTYYPIVYLNAYASFINIDPTLEEQAENLGSRGFHLFRTVTFPLALPGIAAGATLVGIFSLEDLAAPIVFQGNPLARKLMSFQIYSAFTSGFNVGSPQLAALALIMLTIAILMFLGIRKYVSLRQYAMLSKGGRWKPRVAKPKGWQAVLIYLVVLPMLLISIFPQVGVVLLAFSESWSGTWPQGFTTAHIQSIITQPDIERVIMNSIMYSTAAIIVILLLSLTASYASSRFKKSQLGPVLDSLSTIPIAVPGIVIAMSYFFFFAKVFPDTPLDPTNLLGFNPAMVLVLAYSIRRLPFAARSISAGIQQVHVSLEEAALNLGAGRWKALTGILIPLILLNLLGGAMLSFVYCMSETSVGITLGSINPEYYPITARMVELMTSAVGSANLAAALGVFLMTVQIIAIVLANVITKQRYSFIGLT